MKTYYKNKILIKGLIPMENYNIDGYFQKTQQYNDELISKIIEKDFFWATNELINASYNIKGSKDCYYEYFENVDYFELDVDENIYNNKYLLQKYYLSQMISKVFFLEKKLRLLTNVAISLPAFIVEIYDENKKYNTKIGYYSLNCLTFNIRDYDDKLKSIVEKRLNYSISDINLNKLEEKNTRFERALNFYNFSFIPNNINIRFILLESALEALFNLYNKKIKENIAKYGSKILFLDKNGTFEKERILKDYYIKRSFYIHGNNPKEITKNDENILREIVRKILLIYWDISIKEKIYNSKDIIKFLNKIDRNHIPEYLQSFIKLLNME